LLNTEQFDTVVLLLVELTGSVVISLSRSCRQMMRGQAPNIFSYRTATGLGTAVYNSYT